MLKLLPFADWASFYLFGFSTVKLPFSFSQKGGYCCPQILGSTDVPQLIMAMKVALCWVL